jgi:5-methylcytosine-specific restriction enzyme B
MAVWNGREHSKEVLQAAEHWRQQSLEDDGSVFSQRSLWDLNKLSRLLETFRANPLFDRRSFVEKLEVQLQNADPEIQQLAAEVIWALLLFVSDGQMGASAKRERISRIWALSGEPLPDTQWLDDEHLSGVAKPGTAFMTKIPDEFEYALATVAGFKSLDRQQQTHLLQHPFEFLVWLDGQQGGERRAFRHMLLYLLFPSDFERISSWRHKRRIRVALQDRIPTGEMDAADWSLTATDRALRMIRKSLEKEHGTGELDFYVSPLRELWLEPGSDDDTDPQATSGRRCWIEKTIVSGRRDREEGDHAVGNALWSAHRAKSGGDNE